MQMDFSPVLNNLQGQPLKNELDKNLTLGMISINALLFTHADEKNLSGEEKVKRYDLALAIHAATEPLAMTTENVALLKKLISNIYGALVVGQAWKLLEGE